ncbi:hypothetical protein RDWZM_002994 [Blomia tropicalis]|uniref:EGF-like domain-containing protein n=1 Tax=Blomia tropicalis TaxID=40697 RepID=A0A9Q0MFA1_BLOTA|nr:hypothetical protein RDWZM_002994 [Blomia tropicalis]
MVRLKTLIRVLLFSILFQQTFVSGLILTYNSYGKETSDNPIVIPESFRKFTIPPTGFNFRENFYLLQNCNKSTCEIVFSWDKVETFEIRVWSKNSGITKLFINENKVEHDFNEKLPLYKQTVESGSITIQVYTELKEALYLFQIEPKNPVKSQTLSPNVISIENDNLKSFFGSNAGQEFKILLKYQEKASAILELSNSDINLLSKACYELEYYAEPGSQRKFSLSIRSKSSEHSYRYRMFEFIPILDLKQTVQFCVADFIYDLSSITNEGATIQFILDTDGIVTDHSSKSKITLLSIKELAAINVMNIEETYYIAKDSHKKWGSIVPSETISVPLEDKPIVISANTKQIQSKQISSVWLRNGPMIHLEPVIVKLTAENVHDPNLDVRDMIKLDAFICDDIMECIEMRQEKTYNINVFDISLTFDAHPNAKTKYIKLMINIELESNIEAKISLINFGDPCYKDYKPKMPNAECKSNPNEELPGANNFEEAWQCISPYIGPNCNQQDHCKGQTVCTDGCFNRIDAYECICPPNNDIQYWGKNGCASNSKPEFKSDENSVTTWTADLEKINPNIYDVCYKFQLTSPDEITGTISLELRPKTGTNLKHIQLFSEIYFKAKKDDVVVDICLSQLMQRVSTDVQLIAIVKMNSKYELKETESTFYGKLLKDQPLFEKRLTYFMEASSVPSNIINLSTDQYSTNSLKFKDLSQSQDRRQIYLYSKWIENLQNFTHLTVEQINRNMLQFEQDEKSKENVKTTFMICRPRTGEVDDCRPIQTDFAKNVRLLNSDKFQIVVKFDVQKTTEANIVKDFLIKFQIAIWDPCQQVKFCSKINAQCIPLKNDFTCLCPMGYEFKVDTCVRMIIEKVEKVCIPEKKDECFINSIFSHPFVYLPRHFPRLDASRKPDLYYSTVSDSKLTITVEDRDNQLSKLDNDACIKFKYFVAPNSKLSLRLNGEIELLSIEGIERLPVENGLQTEQLDLGLSDDTIVCLKEFLPLDKLNSLEMFELSFVSQINSIDDVVAIELIKYDGENLLETRQIQLPQVPLKYLSIETKDLNQKPEYMEKLSYQWPAKFPNTIRWVEELDHKSFTLQQHFTDTIETAILESAWLNRPIRTVTSQVSALYLNFKVNVPQNFQTGNSFIAEIFLIDEKRNRLARIGEFSGADFKEVGEVSYIFPVVHVNLDHNRMYKIQFRFRYYDRNLYPNDHLSYLLTISEINFADPCIQVDFNKQVSKPRECYGVIDHEHLIDSSVQCFRKEGDNGNVDFQCDCEQNVGLSGNDCGKVNFCEFDHKFKIRLQNDSLVDVIHNGKDYCYATYNISSCIQGRFEVRDQSFKFCEFPGYHKCPQICHNKNTEPYYECSCDDAYELVKSGDDTNPIYKCELKSSFKTTECLNCNGKYRICRNGKCECQDRFVPDGENCVPDKDFILRGCPNNHYKINENHEVVCNCNNMTRDYFIDESIGGSCKLDKYVCNADQPGRNMCAQRNAGCVANPFDIDDYLCKCNLGQLFPNGERVMTASMLAHNPKARCVNICDVPYKESQCSAIGGKCNPIFLWMMKSMVDNSISSIKRFDDIPAVSYCECVPGTFFDETVGSCVQEYVSIKLKVTFKWSHDLETNYELMKKELNLLYNERGYEDGHIDPNKFEDTIEFIDPIDYGKMVIRNHAVNLKSGKSIYEQWDKIITKRVLFEKLEQLLYSFNLIRMGHVIGQVESGEFQIVSIDKIMIDNSPNYVLHLAVKVTEEMRISHNDVTTENEFEYDMSDYEWIMKNCYRLKETSNCIVPYLPLVLASGEMAPKINKPCDSQDACLGMSNCVPMNGSQFSCLCDEKYFTIETQNTFKSNDPLIVYKNERCKSKNLCDSCLAQSDRNDCIENDPYYNNSTGTWMKEFTCGCKSGYGWETPTGNGTRQCTAVCVLAACSENGKCIQNTDHSAICECDSGFYGHKCENETASTTGWIVGIVALAIIAFVAIGAAVFLFLRSSNSSFTSASTSTSSSSSKDKRLDKNQKINNRNQLNNKNPTTSHDISIDANKPNFNIADNGTQTSVAIVELEITQQVESIQHEPYIEDQSNLSEDTSSSSELEDGRFLRSNQLRKYNVLGDLRKSPQPSHTSLTVKEPFTPAISIIDSIPSDSIKNVTFSSSTTTTMAPSSSNTSSSLSLVNSGEEQYPIDDHSQSKSMINVPYVSSNEHDNNLICSTSTNNNDLIVESQEVVCSCFYYRF